MEKDLTTQATQKWENFMEKNRVNNIFFFNLVLSDEWVTCCVF